MGELLPQSMNVKTKIVLERVKYSVRILGLVLIGIIIGVSYLIAYQEYQKVSWGGGEVVEHIVREDKKASTGDLHFGEIAEAKEETPSLSIEDKIRKTFPEEPNTAVATFYGESNHDATLGSHIDKTIDGHSFSWGIAQINITQHKVEGVDCPSAFLGKNSKARVIDRALFDKCVALLTDVDINLKKAREIYDERGSFGAWSVYSSGTYKKHL